MFELIDASYGDKKPIARFATCDAAKAYGLTVWRLQYVRLQVWQNGILRWDTADYGQETPNDGKYSDFRGGD